MDQFKKADSLTEYMFLIVFCAAIIGDFFDIQSVSIYQGKEGSNLVEFGFEAGDNEISSNHQMNGLTIKLYQYFPYYGAKYNYTMISTNGYIGFAHFSEDSHDLHVGLATNWPRESDPAVIAPYLCKQRVDSDSRKRSKVHYRLELRSHTAIPTDSTSTRSSCQGKLPYVYCSRRSDKFLEEMQNILISGTAGGSTFHAEAALVVTWENLAPNIGKERRFSTYQLVWLSDASGTLSYTVINYYRLGYDAADLNGNSITGRCQALFNGGNHTGSVMVDPSAQTKEIPSSLAERSAVPHQVRGRYLHRVDDVVRPAGCSNKTGGTAPLNIYPNTVNMLGETTVDVNGMCLNPSLSYVMMIEQRQVALCHVLNPSIARCFLPRILDWGTKTVYLQPRSGLANEERAYVGYIYFVPPALDPFRLDIGHIYDWYNTIVTNDKRVSWYPRNFTNPQVLERKTEAHNPALYQVQLGLYIYGYKEARDDSVKKFRPMHHVLARIRTFQNVGNEEHKWLPQTEKIDIEQVEQWYINQYEIEELSNYRFGYFKLSTIINEEIAVNQFTRSTMSMVSAPISIHWLWPLIGHSEGIVTNAEERKQFIVKKARAMCFQWFDEDGALPNFIREVESNSSCPCKETQALLDIGRFMPHPRCSQAFRDTTCTETIGSKNCYLSAHNVLRYHYNDNRMNVPMNSFITHYGQVCCYDERGYLMQTSYQSVIAVDDSTPYNPGFPTRAHEFGTPPFQGVYEIPTLSTLHHDLMPFYFCCKFSPNSCSQFYWRRPSSGCQQYNPPFIGTMIGSGVITTSKNTKYIFNDAGVYNLLYSKKTSYNPEVFIQVRMERFPDRCVDFSDSNYEQSKLVQPSNGTVVTGVALQSSDSDRIHIILRKDTRRMRYRTTILVNDVIRYFDNMQFQRYKGISIYVNNVHHGQSDVYVVIHDAQIGLRIRESYAVDMDLYNSYMESFGFLDLLVSLSPHYSLDQNIEDSADIARIEGLLNPSMDSERALGSRSVLTWKDVNDPTKRNDIIQKYRVSNEKGIRSDQLSDYSITMNPMIDLFRSSSDSTFSVLPDTNLKREVYVVDRQYHVSHEFIPLRFELMDQLKTQCFNLVRELGTFELSDKHMINRCNSLMKSLETDCENHIVCQIDSTLLHEKIIGLKSNEEYHSYLDQWQRATIRYNSCGSITLEYPDYMVKGPTRSSSAYLEDDYVIFGCFQDHVPQGDVEYRCTRRVNADNSFEMRWNEGIQPWCRAREKDDLISFTIHFVLLLSTISVIMCLFSLCWILKRLRQKRNEEFVLDQMMHSDERMISRIDAAASSFIPLRDDRNEVAGKAVGDVIRMKYPRLTGLTTGV